jgi:enoyl-[acyl-carrier-protein] reductase (NADH)
MTQPVLEGKVGLVFGVANKRSIAWAIAKAWANAGARLIFNYQGERLKENVEDLVKEFGEGTSLHPCDVSNDAEIAETINKVIRNCSSGDKAKNIYADLNLKELLIRLVQSQYLKRVEIDKNEKKKRIFGCCSSKKRNIKKAEGIH